MRSGRFLAFFFFFFALADLLSRYTELQPVGMGAFGLVWYVFFFFFLSFPFLSFLSLACRIWLYIDMRGSVQLETS